MEITLFHVWQRVAIQDPSYSGLMGKPLDSTYDVYQMMFTTTDREHAVHVTSNSDGRYVFTSAMGYYAVN